MEQEVGYLAFILLLRVHKTKIQDSGRRPSHEWIDRRLIHCDSVFKLRLGFLNLTCVPDNDAELYSTLITGKMKTGCMCGNREEVTENPHQAKSWARSRYMSVYPFVTQHKYLTGKFEAVSQSSLWVWNTSDVS